MIEVRKAVDRGHANHGWLDTAHTFSFGSYYDPKYRGFSVLRVMNEDKVMPGKGFGTHPHKNMEILSLVISGELQHKDSMGNGAVLKPGEVQLISAGSGITHSEFNPSMQNSTHFYQIWIEPQSLDTEPRYQQRAFSPADQADELLLVASQSGEKNSLVINQDVKIYVAKLSAGSTITLPAEESRSSWLQVIDGEVSFAENKLITSDGAAIGSTQAPTLASDRDSFILFFDLP